MKIGHKLFSGSVSYFTTIFDRFVGTLKQGISGKNLPLTQLFSSFFLNYTFTNYKKQFLNTFFENIFQDMLPFKNLPLNFVYQPAFISGLRMLGNSAYVSNSHLTFSSVLAKFQK